MVRLECTISFSVSRINSSSHVLVTDSHQVVGSDEEEGQTVNVRARNDENIDPNNVGRAEARSQGVIKFETALGSLLRLRDSRAMGNNM